MKLQTFEFQLEISFIKQKLSKVISQGSSSSMVKDAGVRYGGLWFELWYVFFPPDIFCTPLFEYLDPAILHLLGFYFITLSL